MVFGSWRFAPAAEGKRKYDAKQEVWKVADPLKVCVFRAEAQPPL